MKLINAVLVFLVIAGCAKNAYNTTPVVSYPEVSTSGVEGAPSSVASSGNSLLMLKSTYGQCGVLSRDQLSAVNNLGLQGKRYALLSVNGSQPQGPYVAEAISYEPIQGYSGYYKFVLDGIDRDAAETYVELYEKSKFVSLSNEVGCQASGVAKSVKLK